MTRIAVTASDGVAVGPYSHGIDAGGAVYLSGQTPMDPQTGTLVTGSVGAQTRRCLDSLAAVLAAAGLGLDDVVKCGVFLTDMRDFPEMNVAYEAYFCEPYPARTTVAVAGLPLGARVEIDMVAMRP